MSCEEEEGKILSAPGEGWGPHPRGRQRHPYAASPGARRVCALRHSVLSVVLTAARAGDAARSGPEPGTDAGAPEGHFGRRCTLMTSSSADLHSTDSDTSTTDPSS